MARPAKFTNDQVLDASLTLVHDAGASGLTMTGVAEALGAPSGSIYHRFSSRDVLVAELWLRSVERFQTGLFAAMQNPDPLAAAVDAARHVVHWSRNDLDHARLLLVHRSRDLLSDGWPDEVIERNDAQRRLLKHEMNNLFERLGAHDAPGRRRARFAIVSIPYGAVRPALGAGTRPEPELEELVAEAAHAILSELVERTNK
ncbi:MAG: TetR/AcrR family transcriptional regulator [Acidimicrobiales bacterium]